MTRQTATVTALPRVIDRTDWAAVLESALLPQWRPQEWDPGTLLFTGLLDTAETVAYTCITPDCGRPSLNSKTPCTSCKKQLKDYRGDPAAFRPTDKTRRGFTRIAEPCLISHNGQTCQRSATSRGLCRSHYQLWLTRHRAASLEEFAAGCTTLHEYLGDCRVLGCDYEMLNANPGLCVGHRSNLDKKRQQGGQLSAGEYIATARPSLGAHQFSLAGLPATLRCEILYGLQRRDDDGGHMWPQAVRALLRSVDEQQWTSLLDINAATLETYPQNGSGRPLLRSARVHLTRLRVRHGLHDPYAGDVWDAAVLRLPTKSGKAPATTGGAVVDFSDITVPWIKEVAKEWVRATEPQLGDVGHALCAAKWACQALHLRAGGHDPTRLGLADMTAVIDAFNTVMKPDDDGGGPYSWGYRNHNFRAWRTLLEFGRAKGLMNVIPDEFAVMNSTHQIDVEEPEEEKAGKSLPAQVIRFLDAHIHALRPPTDKGASGGLSADDIALMWQTMYVIFRNTGRRIEEVMSLKRDCLRYNASGDASLVYDNHKAKRLGRWLPIHKDTATTVERWQQHLDPLELLPTQRGWLFPAAGRRKGHYSAAAFSRTFFEWRKSLPPIPYGGIDEHGNQRFFNKSVMTSHAFRHTYAQRHADGGTPVDVLRELMDHKSINTTMGYYQVGLERKADAVRTVGALSVDRDGHRSPPSSVTAYEAASVAVPFGNCTEPSNVKAGGDHCPIRFQCSGCDFYRPDPSFLPAIEDQIAKLRLEREHATTVNAAQWVIKNYDDQINSFKTVTTAMNALIEKLPDEQRTALEEASVVLRRTRGARTYLPITPVSKDSKHE